MYRIKIEHLILLIISCLAISCTNDDSINDNYIKIPDRHFEAILIEQGIDSDGIINQQILKSDAEDVTLLDLNLAANFGEISDLTGIEGFVNLKLLSAAGQKIEHVNLSSNTLLDTLYLSANYISNIDISNNPNLLLIDIQSNELSSLTGLSAATHLKKLNLSFNNLKEFNVDNESVEVLLISDNLLTSFNTNNAINLKSIFLKSNKIPSLDLSTNTLLKTLVLSDNEIEEINFDQNNNLTHLYISSNLLANLNVSSLQKLIDLRITRNPNLTCIKIESGQNIPTVEKSDYQELNYDCN